MANTTPDGIYYPDSNTLMNFDAILATMASSIQNGIGKRLALQEIAVGLKAGLANQIQLTTTPINMPLVVNGSNGNFAQGMTINNGIVTVATPGMYMVSSSIGIMPHGGGASATSALALYKNNVKIMGDEQSSHPSFYQVSKGTTVINRVAGDTIRLTGRSGGASVMTAIDQELTQLAVVMVQAIPQA